MKRMVTILLVLMLFAASNAAWAVSKQAQKMQDAVAVLNDFVNIPENAIPPALLSQAYGIAVIPGVIKAGFVVGGRYGTGVLSVRTANGKWSHPVFIRLAGASLGWQIGASSTDVILVFKTQRGVDKIINGEVTLGAGASVAAGPVGRTAGAATNLQLDAEIYSYSRSRGLFAGVSLKGGVITIDADSNWAYYGSKVDSRTILHRSSLRQLPKTGQRFVYTLDQYMPSSDTSTGPIPYGDTGHAAAGPDNGQAQAYSAGQQPQAHDGGSKQTYADGQAQAYGSGQTQPTVSGGGKGSGNTSPSDTGPSYGPVYDAHDAAGGNAAGKHKSSSANTYNDIAGSGINY